MDHTGLKQLQLIIRKLGSIAYRFNKSNPKIQSPNLTKNQITPTNYSGKGFPRQLIIDNGTYTVSFWGVYIQTSQYANNYSCSQKNGYDAVGLDLGGLGDVISSD